MAALSYLGRFKKFYRPDEVATMLGVSIRTVQRWARSGVIPSSTVNGLLRISIQDLEETIESGKLALRASRLKPSAGTCVYQAYDYTGALLYVGSADDWGRQWAGHSVGAAFYALVSRLEIAWYASREEAAEVEAYLISAQSPRFNLLHPA